MTANCEARRTWPNRNTDLIAPRPVRDPPTPYWFPGLDGQCHDVESRFAVLLVRFSLGDQNLIVSTFEHGRTYSISRFEVPKGAACFRIDCSKCFIALRDQETFCLEKPDAI